MSTKMFSFMSLKFYRSIKKQNIKRKISGIDGVESETMETKSNLYIFHVIKLSPFALIVSVRIKKPHQSKSDIYGSYYPHGPKRVLFSGALG